MKASKVDFINRIYLKVPFEEKEAAKANGAKFDFDRRRWWIDRRDIGCWPAVHRWMDTGMLSDKTKEAERFCRRHAWGQSFEGTLVASAYLPWSHTSVF